MKQKKDIIFVIVLGISLVNLVLIFTGTISGLINAINIDKGWSLSDYVKTVAWILIDGLAIIGILYLLRSYKRARKETKRLEQEQKAREETE